MVILCKVNTFTAFLNIWFCFFSNGQGLILDWNALIWPFLRVFFILCIFLFMINLWRKWNTVFYERMLLLLLHHWVSIFSARNRFKLLEVLVDIFTDGGCVPYRVLGLQGLKAALDTNTFMCHDALRLAVEWHRCVRWRWCDIKSFQLNMAVLQKLVDGFDCGSYRACLRL